MTQARQAPSPMRWIPVAVFAYLFLMSVSRAKGLPDFMFDMYNDSALRLVEVRDLLNGQPWFDLTQPRLGLDGGFEMHWSRLVDAPIAGLILLFDLVTTRAQAEYLAIFCWPLILLALTMWLVGRIAATLGGRSAAPFAAALAGFMLWLEVRFLPGSIDHHNVQIALFLTMLLGILGRRESRWLPVLAGVALAASLAVGVETLPLLAMGTLGLAGFWLALGAPERAPVLGFAAGGIGGLLVLFVALAPASAYRGGFCDALSIDLAVPVALGLGAMALAALTVSGRGLALRGAVLGALFAGVAGGTLAALPSCLNNPLDALDPYLAQHWLAFVTEARGLGDLLRSSGLLFLYGYYLVGLATIILSAWFAWNQRSASWLLMTLLLIGALALTIYQLRGASALLTLCAPVLGVLITRLHQIWQRDRRPIAALAAFACFLLAVPMTWGEILDGTERVISQVAGPAHAATSAKTDTRACFTAKSTAALAALPTGVVSAPSNLGTQILLHSAHRTLSAPYHRNQGGMRRQLEITLAQSPAEAHSLLTATGIDYLVLCPDDPELVSLHRHGYSGFGYEVERGAVPAFLDPVAHGDSESGLLIFRVR
ncbi:hypothetical protein Q4543_13505 [Salipiger sp. 1_MG-2023]|uniref:hypothetical protein n=1 Tax=Salipiger sp. 1_MG-2023 TaxID=3062665 RepID=UPI0026E273FC|nr:hypothetical protein [Salipiger sp. 1_MG-2023]MDO6586529.1 hypothetical protein [Salipiger sp. 1_MG-2023]